MKMTSTANGITLRGSAEMVAEFFCKYLRWYFLFHPFVSGSFNRHTQC